METNAAAEDGENMMEVDWDNPYTIHATSPDGWAILLHKGTIYQARPPYDHAHLDVISPEFLMRCLSQEDFELMKPPVHSNCLEAAGKYLEEKRVREASPEDLAQAGDAALRLLQFASHAQVERALGKIERGAPYGGERKMRAVLALQALSATPAYERDPVVRARIDGWLSELAR